MKAPKTPFPGLGMRLVLALERANVRSPEDLEKIVEHDPNLLLDAQGIETRGDVQTITTWLRTYRVTNPKGGTR